MVVVYNIIIFGHGHCKCIVNIVYLPTCVYAHYCLLLFDELMGHSVLNDVKNVIKMS